MGEEDGRMSVASRRAAVFPKKISARRHHEPISESRPVDSSPLPYLRLLSSLVHRPIECDDLPEPEIIIRFESWFE